MAMPGDTRYFDSYDIAYIQKKTTAQIEALPLTVTSS